MSYCNITHTHPPSPPLPLYLPSLHGTTVDCVTDRPNALFEGARLLVGRPGCPRGDSEGACLLPPRRGVASPAPPPPLGVACWLSSLWNAVPPPGAPAPLVGAAGPSPVDDMPRGVCEWKRGVVPPKAVMFCRGGPSPRGVCDVCVEERAKPGDSVRSCFGSGTVARGTGGSPLELGKKRDATKWRRSSWSPDTSSRCCSSPCMLMFIAVVSSLSAAVLAYSAPSSSLSRWFAARSTVISRVSVAVARAPCVFCARALPPAPRRCSFSSSQTAACCASCARRRCFVASSDLTLVARRLLCRVRSWLTCRSFAAISSSRYSEFCDSECCVFSCSTSSSSTFFSACMARNTACVVSSDDVRRRRVSSYSTADERAADSSCMFSRSRFFRRLAICSASIDAWFTSALRRCSSCRDVSRVDVAFVCLKALLKARANCFLFTTSISLRNASSRNATS
eukprot:Rhum_TRINITY_DN15185_c20_g1::Rhum_TRINITY_DN15185_c20_g1_i1::g.143020::m.143020